MKNRKKIIFLITLCVIISIFVIHGRTISKYRNPVIVELDRAEILSAQPDEYQENSVLHWNSYTNYSIDVNDGYIPSELLSDPVYCSMNLPSESQSDYMISINRDNAHMIGNTSADRTKYVLGMGAFYQTTGEELPDNFSIYLGKIKVFAYSKSKHKWITIDSQPYPTGVFVFTLPWETTTAIQCENITYTDDYIKVDLSSEELSGNVLHFWGSCAPLPANKDDYLYFACAYEFWVSENVANKLTATNGIDAKDEDMINGECQLYSSRGLAATAEKRIHWGHTIPNDEYMNCEAYKLNDLFNKQ